MIGKIIKKKKNLLDKKDLIFYITFAALPVLQFLIFYIFVNGNSILLSFKDYNYLEKTYSWVGIDNIKKVLFDIFNDKILIQSAKNSIVVYFICLFTGLPLSLLFSFYIYKKMKFATFFKIVLFLPSMISSIVMVILFSYFVDRALPELIFDLFKKQVPGILTNQSTQFATILFYTIWIGFGSSILIYSGAMSGIDESVVESCKLDGAGNIKEFFHITIPMIWPTISTFLVVGVAGIFINQVNVFSFFNSDAPTSLYTFGYYLYKEVLLANNIPGGIIQFPYLSAMGLLMTLVAVPITFLIKHLLEKYGFKEE